MTQEATKFITPLTFEALTSNKVLTQESEDWSSDFNHIGLATWCDCMIIAPATANSINKLSNGIADNLLTQTAIACNKPKIIAPSANTLMLESPITQASLKMLKLNAYTICESRIAELACKTKGNGALAEPLDIYYSAVRVLYKDDYFQYRNIVISGGGTIEKIDDVRYLSNFSSGKMANSLALMAYLLGAQVTLVTTKLSHALPKAIQQHLASSTQEMKDALTAILKRSNEPIISETTLLGNSRPQDILKTPIFFSAAAVSDYVPTKKTSGKLKKIDLGQQWNLTLHQNSDILKEVVQDNVIRIGFKAEFDSNNALESAKTMLEHKNLDGVALNVLGGDIHFGSDHSQMTFITSSKIINIKNAPKVLIAYNLLHQVKGSFQ
jgi:phosphopantothenoylcysteine decarboxylase/phosphopantothenate--cysteine ligase